MAKRSPVALLCSLLKVVSRLSLRRRRAKAPCSLFALPRETLLAARLRCGQPWPGVRPPEHFDGVDRAPRPHKPVSVRDDCVVELVGLEPTTRALGLPKSIFVVQRSDEISPGYGTRPPSAVDVFLCPNFTPAVRHGNAP